MGEDDDPAEGRIVRSSVERSAPISPNRVE
jgi:hypothetical protein